MPFFIIAAIPISSCSNSNSNWTAGEISDGIEMCETIEEGSYQEEFDTAKYCRCTTNKLSNSTTVEEAADASIKIIIINMDELNALKSHSKLYHEIEEKCANSAK